jgi:uncharacterized protein (DUF2267 family)
MSATGLDTFDRTIHETNRWLRIVMIELKTDNRRHAYAALRAGLHALRDRIGPENAVHFGAQLPTLLRGVYYEGWRPSETPTRERRLDDFLAYVESMLGSKTAVDPADALHATFAAIAESVPFTEVIKLVNVLPRELKALWPEYKFEKLDADSIARST